MRAALNFDHDSTPVHPDKAAFGCAGCGEETQTATQGVSRGAAGMRDGVCRVLSSRLQAQLSLIRQKMGIQCFWQVLSSLAATLQNGDPRRGVS